MSLRDSHSRREFLKGALAFAASTVFFGCEQTFVRPEQEFDLGEVKNLLYANQHLRSLSLLVSRDGTGWRTMSTRCTHDGCDLTYQQQNLLCMCCYSIFAHSGEILKGPARISLPYYRMSYREEHLYADTAQSIAPTERFTTPEIEAAIAGVKQRLEYESARPGARIPDSLLGQHGPADQVEGMFKESADVAIPSLAEESPPLFPPPP